MTKSTTVRKKLIEVSIPLEVINRESAREKSIRHGHPSTLHLWWARRPLAACRAVLFAQFVDDPSACPEEFPTVELQKVERDRLHKLIERLVPWDASNNEIILTDARYEIARSVAREKGETLPPLAQMKPQAIIDYLQTNAPPVYDPFSGGGSIPLEAQRLGLKAMGSDLNPVAVLIGKALIEFPPKFAGRKPVNPEVNELHQWKDALGLADDVRYYGLWMRAEAEKKIGYLYPKVKLKDGKTDATVIAWLWARTVPSPDPRAKGAHVPLASSFVLSAKVGKEVIIKPVVDRAKMTWEFEVDDRPSKDALNAAKDGTKAARATFACLLTGAPIGGEYINAEAQAGRMSERLMAIVAESSGGRVYLPPTADHMSMAEAAGKIVAERGDEMGLPTQECRGTFASNAQGRRYKFKTFADYFTPRQLLALTTFSDLVMEAREQALADTKKRWSGQHADDTRRLTDGGLGPTAYADAVTTYLGFAVDKAADRNSSLCAWEPNMNRMRNTFGRQGLAMVWDFVETNPLSGAGGDIAGTAHAVFEVLHKLKPITVGSIRSHDAQSLTHATAPVFSTDPPYYNNIGYADLSDFFYVWLRRSLSGIYPDLFRRVVTAKAEELIANPYRHGGKDEAEAFFLDGMKKALSGIARTSADVPATVYYAFKQSELSEEGVASAGWASFLQAVVDSGLAVDGTWPVRSELATRNVASGTNALASSIVLVCRRRSATASTVTRVDFLRALRREMPAALTEIRRAGVGPTDIQQAAIGPGIGIFTRHAQVIPLIFGLIPKMSHSRKKWDTGNSHLLPFREQTMAFEIRKISDVGVGHPVVARLGLQASDLSKWIDIEDDKRKEIVGLYVRTLTERLLRCHQFRDDLVNRANEASKTAQPPQNDKRIREVPHVIGLQGIAEGFLYEAKNYLRDLLNLFRIAYGCKLTDASAFTNLKGDGDSQIVTWAASTFGPNGDLTKLLRTEQEWVAEPIRMRNAVEHPGGLSGTLTLSNIRVDPNQPGSYIPPTWTPQDARTATS